MGFKSLPQKWMITGASGLLGYNVCHYFHAKGNDVYGVSYAHDIGIHGVKDIKQDLLDFSELESLFVNVKPDILFHCAAMTNVDECEDNPAATRKYNSDLPKALAELCNIYDVKMVYITTDQLWDGTQSMMDEETPVSPVNIYAQTKADSEAQVMDATEQALIIRTNFFGHGRPWRLSFTDWLDQQLSQGKTINGFDDIYYTPIAIDYLLSFIEQLVAKGAKGVYHVCGSERISKYEFIKAYAHLAGYDEALINQATSQDGNLKAKRPKDMSMASHKVVDFLGVEMPTLSENLQTVIKKTTNKRKVS